MSRRVAVRFPDGSLNVPSDKKSEQEQLDEVRAEARRWNGGTFSTEIAKVVVLELEELQEVC